MAYHGDVLEAGGFYFIHNFDSGNLGHVERVPTEHIISSINYRTNNLETPEFEFNIWTRPDCYGTEFENGNRTWFYFGVQGGQPGTLVRLNIINLNKQGKMYSQGMAPVTRTLPGQPHWERIRDRPVHSNDENAFTVTFKYRTPENMKATTFFAFTYPFSFTELQISLNSVDLKFLPPPATPAPDDIYYCRENLISTLEGRRTDLLTISSYNGITNEREERLKHLFPDRTERPFKFANKKVVFLSARVHPGETPSSFVFNGFLNLLLTRNDPIAIQLRRLYVFKLVPFLNPDGVARGHYRTDTRGVNLNRVYLNPSLEHHPTIYAARALIRYYHFGCEREDDFEEIMAVQSYSRSSPSASVEPIPVADVKKKKGALKPKENKREISNQSQCSVRTLVATDSISSSQTGTSTVGTTTTTFKVDRTAHSSTGDSLAAKVCDLKLQEKDSSSSDRFASETSTEACVTRAECSLLDDVVVRDCLGSEVHLSRSDELSCITGPNPLRQLRDTLKNSISLLIGGTFTDASSHREEALWPGSCPDCKTKVEQDPSLANSPDMSKSIGAELKSQKLFCTRCYTPKEAELETEIRTSESSGAVSGGDRADVGSSLQSSEEPHADSNGDIAVNKAKSPTKPRKKSPIKPTDRKALKEPDSGIFLYVDLHGHASKKGIFMYGNHFDEPENSVECMLLPRIMSLNNLHFHFSSCNFTERNMYLRDRRDGMSREGSGRVAVLKATGLIRSYTLECNYNTGRLVNVLPPTLRDAVGATTSPPATPLVPPKYTPHIFEEVGRSLGSSILDLTGQHPNSRIPASEHRSIASVKEWLKTHMRTMRPSQFTMPRLRPKPNSPTRAPLYTRCITKNKMADVERKENTYIGAKAEDIKKPAVSRTGRSTDLSTDRYVSVALAKKPEKPFVARAACCSDSEPKPKNLAAKRRNVLAIRKPNAGKARVASGGKTKPTRRTAEEAGAAPTAATGRASKPTTGSFTSRSFCRDTSRSDKRNIPTTSSSEEAVLNWDEAGSSSGAKRRPYPLTAPRRKKIRLKTAL